MEAVKEKWQACLPYLVMGAFALTRWPGLMPNNFSAAYALAFCAGVFFPGKQRWWLPMATLLVTDLALNAYYRAPLLGVEMLGNYVAYAALIGLGGFFRGRASFLNLLGGGVFGAILFYLVTNTMSWLSDPAYPKTLAGWLQALTVGRPEFPHTWEFFRNTLMSGGLFSGLFAGAMKLAESSQEEEQTQEENESEEEPTHAEPEEAKG